MQRLAYSLCIAASTVIFLPPAHATATRHVPIDSPADAQRKAAREKKAVAREKVATAKQAAKLTKVASRTRKASAKLRRTMLVLLGLEESKAVTSPAKLNRQLHLHQNRLKLKAKMAAKARRARVHE